MEVMGICTICGRAAKLYTCPLCGKLVCGRCMDPEKGICVHCAQGKRGEGKPFPRMENNRTKPGLSGKGI